MMGSLHGWKSLPSTNHSLRTFFSPSFSFTGSSLQHAGFSSGEQISYPVACGILVPWPGIKLKSHTVEARLLTTGPPGKSPSLLTFCLHTYTQDKPLQILPGFCWTTLQIQTVLIDHCLETATFRWKKKTKKWPQIRIYKVCGKSKAWTLPYIFSLSKA